MTFSIVIPAFNEELSARGILERALAAAAQIRSAGLGIKEVEVLLVDDSSTDRTGEAASAVAGARVVTHAAKRGYGAAIKTGFSAAKGDWLGFCDADGTYDPEFFRHLLALSLKDGLDLAVGSRMHPSSRMPAIRALGNRGFRTLVNLIGSSSLTDVTSGMRVLKRSALPKLYPLPDGLDFTPAMSVRAVLDRELRMGEIPIPYGKRVGRSKLIVAIDGPRFIGVILDTALAYRPRRLLGAAAWLCGLLALWALLWRRGVLVGSLLTAAAFFTALGCAAQSLVSLARKEQPCLPGRLFAALATACAFMAASLSWVSPVAGAFCALSGLQFAGFALLGRIARRVRERSGPPRKL